MEGGKKMRERRRRSWMEGEGEKAERTGRSAAPRGGGIALSLLLVTPSQPHGFMERFLSWCCFLIDIKMH